MEKIIQLCSNSLLHLIQNNLKRNLASWIKLIRWILLHGISKSRFIASVYICYDNFIKSDWTPILLYSDSRNCIIYRFSKTSRPPFLTFPNMRIIVPIIYTIMSILISHRTICSSYSSFRHNNIVYAHMLHLPLMYS